MTDRETPQAVYGIAIIIAVTAIIGLGLIFTSHTVAKGIANADHTLRTFHQTWEGKP